MAKSGTDTTGQLPVQAHLSTYLPCSAHLSRQARRPVPLARGRSIATQFAGVVYKQAWEHGRDTAPGHPVIRHDSTGLRLTSPPELTLGKCRARNRWSSMWRCAVPPLDWADGIPSSRGASSLPRPYGARPPELHCFVFDGTVKLHVGSHLSTGSGSAYAPVAIKPAELSSHGSKNVPMGLQRRPTTSLEVAAPRHCP